jgi:hypothetical protein
MRNTIIANCLDIIKKDDFKKEMKILSQPIIEVLVDELKPYIFTITLFLIVNFVIVVGVMMYLFRINKDIGRLKLPTAV